MVTQEISRILARLLAAVFVLAAGVPPFSVNEPTEGWRMVGQIGGPTQAVAVQGNYAYVGVGLRLVVLDVSDPADLVEVGNTAPFPYFVEDVVVQGDLAYVAAGGAGLRAVDITDPANPVELGAWDSPGYAEGVAVSGNTAYLADGPYGLWTVDVSDPAHPQKTGAAYDMNYAFEVEIDWVDSGKGDSGRGDSESRPSVQGRPYAFIAAAGAGLLVADVSDPAHPLEVGALDTPGYAFGMAISQGIVYIADGWEGLHLVNINDPRHPNSIGMADTPGWAFGVDVDNGRAYVADAFMGLRVLDISNPGQLVELGGYSVEGGHAGRVIVNGSSAYVADRNFGLRVIEISDPQNLAEIGHFEPLATANAVAVQGNYAFVAADINGLSVIDIANPREPRQVGMIPFIEGGRVQFTYAVAVSGNYAYMGDKNYVQTVDVSDPTNPTLVEGAQIPLISEMREMAISGEILYIAEGEVELIDISDPTNPSKLGYVELSYAAGVAVSGPYAYIAHGQDGLYILDVSNPITPTVIGSLNMGAAGDVAISGNLAYLIASARGGLSVVDVSDPTQPLELDFLRMPEVYAVTVKGTLAFVADGTRGLSIFDISNPSDIKLVESVNTLGFAREIDEDRDQIYIADSSGGLAIFARGSILSAAEPAEQSLSYSHDLEFTPLTADDHNFINRIYPQNDQTINRSTQPRRERAEASTICVVNNPGSSGPGTLSDCLQSAQAGDTITFDPTVFPPENPTAIITSQIGLPGYVTIDASNAGVILDGSITPYGYDGFYITSNGNTIKGLQILNFGGDGIGIAEGASNNTIGGDPLVGNGPSGEGNVIGGNGHGIQIQGEGTANNLILGNKIGTDASGTVNLGNRANGVQIGGAQGNRVGPNNRISYNAGAGVSVDGAMALGNTITANTIYDNVGPGIILPNNGNNSMAAPNFTSVTPTTAYGTAQPGATVEIFSAQRPDEGRVYEGSTVATASGDFTLNKPSMFAGPLLTATATDAQGNTSQFSPPAVVYHTTHVVTSPLDSGQGTLRQALLESGIGDIITFAPSVFPPDNPVTIFLTSQLPPLTQGELILDASDAGVILDGSLISQIAHGLEIRSDGNTIQGLQILHFPEMGIQIWDGNDNLIGGDRGQGNGPVGQGNVISGNRWGIDLCCGGAINNVIVGNLVGTTASGSEALGNREFGIYIHGGATNNRVGGLAAWERNIVSGNYGNGIDIMSSGGNSVIGNYAGTDISGKRALGNGLCGIAMELGGFNNLIQGNLASGNQVCGIYIGDWGSEFNVVIGNMVGTDITGTKGLGNSGGINLAARFNRIGGTRPEERNLISGNKIEVGSGSTFGGENYILGNFIGPNITGDRVIGNDDWDFVFGIGGNTRTISGGATTQEMNVIGGKGGDALLIGSDYNVVSGNFIGTDVTGSFPLEGGGTNGVILFGEHNVLQANLFAFSTSAGVQVDTYAYNTLRRNAIFNNAGPGIDLIHGGNNLLPAPVITAVTSASVAGTACPGCTVEVFSDAEDEGQFYEGTTVADLTGHWLLLTDHFLTGPHLTATATDALGNTSQFSLPAILGKRIHLPLILKGFLILEHFFFWP